MEIPEEISPRLLLLSLEKFCDIYHPARDPAFIESRLFTIRYPVHRNLPVTGKLAELRADHFRIWDSLSASSGITW